ncbi:MAG: TolC family protein [Vicinamibacteria bacterium]|nr:TolC family protein [Vicinamibacteria bacterium]
MAHFDSRSLIPIAFCLIGILGSTDCAHYEARPITAPAVLQAIEARSLTSNEMRDHLQAARSVAEWPPAFWDLRMLTLAAFQYHPDLAVARAVSKSAVAAITTAGERPNPSLTTGPGYNSTSDSSVVSPWIFDIGLGLTIETAGKRGYQIAQAKELSAASRLNIATVAWQVRGRVRESLLALFAARRRGGLLARQEELQSTLASLVERQWTAGAISRFELSRARAALIETQIAQKDTARAEAEARVSLAAALGVTPEAIDEVTLSFGDLERIPPDLTESEARRQALLNRPDVLGTLMEYAASQSALQLAVARQYPDLNLGPGYQLDQGDSKWSLSLGGLLSIFHRNRGPIAEAEAKRAEAAARFTGVQSRAIEQIEQASVASRAARDKVAAVDELLSNRQEQLRTIESQHRAGEVSRLDVVSAELDFARVELARLEALLNFHAAIGLTEDAMQSPADLAAWLPDPMPVPSPSPTPPSNTTGLR